MLKNVILFCSFIVLLLGPLQTIQAQNNVGIGTLTPSTDAILELFSNDKGFLAPRVTSVERATIPANSSGLLVFDTDENKFFYWNAALSIWQVMDDFSNTNELLQIAAFDDITKQITLTDAGATYTLDLNILSQRLSFSNDTLYISDKNGIDLGIYNKDSSATNELIQTTAFDQTTKQITLTDAGATFTLDLDTLSQRLSFSNDTLSISDRNKIDLGSYNKDSSASNELLQIAAFDQTTKQITLTDAGASFTLDLDTLSQLLSFSNDTLSISDRNKIDLGGYNKDSSATNELQSLSTSNDTIFMDRRGFIKLSEDEFWNTDGNAGTSPSNQFIGTTDNQDFVIRTDNTERLRTLGANGNIGIGTTAPDEKLDVQGNIELSGGNRSIHTQVSPLGRGGYSLTLRASNHNNNGNFAVNGGHVILQGGSGYNIDQGLGGGNVYLRSGHNDLTSNPGQRNGGYIIFETGGASGSKAERARMLDNGNFGIGTTLPTTQLDLTGQIRIRGGAPATGKVLTSNAVGLATWQTPVTVSANNGLNKNGNTVRLGGTLLENTTITQGAFGVTYNLSGTGDFNIQDNGVNHFAVTDFGTVYVGGSMEWRDESTAGTLLANLVDDDNDGRFKIMENGLTSVDLDANTQFIFNEQGLNRDFRVESNDDQNLIFANGGTNKIGIGTSAPGEKLDVQGNIELSGGNRSIHTQVSPLGRGGYSLTLRASNHNNNGNFAVNGGHVILQGGSGYNTDQGLGGGNVYLRSGHNDLTSNPGQRNGGYIIFETGGASGSKAERARMLDNGNFGIGTTNPGAKFQVGNKGDASFARANSWATFSDRRLKNKIELITNALDKLDQIHGYTYNWKNKSDSSRQVGVIAQEIELVMPEAVKTGSDGYKTVDYGKLSALLIQAVREQQTIITSLENKIEQQNTTIRDVKNAQKSLDERLLILEKK